MCRYFVSSLSCFCVLIAVFGITWFALYAMCISELCSCWLWSCYVCAVMLSRLNRYAEDRRLLMFTYDDRTVVQFILWSYIYVDCAAATQGVCLLLLIVHQTLHCARYGPMERQARKMMDKIAWLEKLQYTA